MHTCIKCGYVGIGMLLAFMVSDWTGIHEFSRIGALVIGVIGGGLGYLFSSVLLSSSSGQRDEGRLGTVRTADTANSLQAGAIEK